MAYFPGLGGVDLIDIYNVDADPDFKFVAYFPPKSLVSHISILKTQRNTTIIDFQYFHPPDFASHHFPFSQKKFTKRTE